MSYDARDPASIRHLALALAGLPVASRPAVAARIMSEGIMLPTQYWVRFGMWLVKKRHGVDDYSAWAHLLSRVPKVADEIFAQTAEWVVAGKDASGEGVGGLNQAEIDTLARLINVVSGAR